jgi:nucleoside-diphosphate-sugar epimerase
MMNAVSSGSMQLKASRSRSGLDACELRQLVHRNESIFTSLTGASILITGATGWFGVWLLDLLCTADDMLRLGIQIAAVSREPSRFLVKYRDFAGDSRISWVKADVRQLEARGRGFSHIIHAATDTSMPTAPDVSLQLFETIIEGTRRVIAAAGPLCKSVLLLSSGAVYGPAREGTVRFVETESGGPDPSSVKSTYAEGKRAAEQLGAIAATMGVPIRIARCFAFVGPHMPFDRHFAIGNFIADAVRGHPIHVKSDGLPLRSYLYMTDLMVALLLILTKGSIGKPYNVGSDFAVTIEQLAHCVDRVVGGQGVSRVGAASDSCDRYVPDITRLKTELDFAPEVALETAIARTAAWYRARTNESMSS